MQSVTNKVIPDQRHVKVRPLYTDTIPGEMLVLCMDCNTGWDLRATTCPACGSRAALHVIKTLDRRGVEVSR